MSWEKLGDAPSYELQRREMDSALDTDAAYEVIYEGESSFYVDRNVDGGKTYEYRVRAVRKRNKLRKLQSDASFSQAARAAPLGSLKDCSYTLRDVSDKLAEASPELNGSPAYALAPKDKKRSAVGDDQLASDPPLLMLLYPATENIAQEGLQWLNARLYAEAAMQTLTDGGALSRVSQMSQQQAYVKDAYSEAVVLPDTLSASEAFRIARSITGLGDSKRANCAIFRARATTDSETVSSDVKTCRFISVHGPNIELNNEDWVNAFAAGISRGSTKDDATFVYVTGRGRADTLKNVLDVMSFHDITSFFGGSETLALVRVQDAFHIEPVESEMPWDIRLDVSYAMTASVALLSAPDVEDVIKDKPQSRNNVRMNVVFGILGIDRSRVDRNDIFAKYIGDPVFDEGFDASDVVAQNVIHQACSTIGERTDLALPLEDSDVGSTDGSGSDSFETRSCVMTDFHDFVTEQGLPFPVSSRSDFYTLFFQFLTLYPDHRYNVNIVSTETSNATASDDMSEWYDLDYGVEGELQTSKVKVSWVRLQFKTPMPELIPSFEAYRKYKDWDAVIKRLRHEIGRNSVFTACDLWPRMQTEVDAVSGTTRSLIIAVSCAFLSILFFTGDIMLSSLTTASLFSILSSLLAVIWYLGWSIGAVEAISMAILVGCSVDFCLHIAEAYANVARSTLSTFGTEDPGCIERTKHAVMLRGPSVLSSAMTTVGACIPLTMCTLQILAKFGVMLTCIMSIAMVTTLTCFSALLMRYGPEEGYKNKTVLAIERTCLSTPARCAATTLCLAACICAAVEPMRESIAAHPLPSGVLLAAVVLWLVWEHLYPPPSSRHTMTRREYFALAGGMQEDEDHSLLELQPLTSSPPSPLSDITSDDGL